MPMMLMRKMMKKGYMMKKGFFHTMDAFFATIILVALLTFSLTLFSSQDTYFSITSEAEDISMVLSELSVGELNNAYVQQLIADSHITNVNRSVLEQIGTFWAENRTDLAEGLADAVLAGIVDSRTSIELRFDDVLVYSENRSSAGVLSGSRRMVSGIAQERPVTGISSRVFVKSIKRKTTNAFITFGGFVGQGNVTKSISLNSDSIIVSMDMVLDAGDDFYLFINGQRCLGTFTPTGINLTADYWNITACAGMVWPGRDIVNNFTFEFSDYNFSSAYIGGGHIRIRYSTESFYEDLEINSTHQQLPGVSGLINVFSSTYVPGTLESMSIYLHYLANHSYNNATFYVRLGNEAVFEDLNSTDEAWVTIGNSTLGQLLNYGSLSEETVPLRIGFENLTLTNATVGNADVVLITDLSGSMNWCLDGYDGPGTCGGCTDISGGNPCRIELARQLNADFVSTVLSSPGNRVALVTYSYSGSLLHSLSANLASLQSAIAGMSASGATCIGCAIRVARRELLDNSGPSRDQFILVMTDGVVNMRTYQPNIERTSCCTSWVWSCGWPWCGRDLDYDPACGDSIDTTARDYTLYDACAAYADTNATIHSIGFGAGAVGCDYATATLEGIAQCGSGDNYSGTDVAELQNIYDTIAQDVVVESTASQMLAVSGNLQPSVLYPDSYIEYNYSSDFNPFEHGEIAIVFDRQGMAGCTDDVDVPQQVTVANAYVTSFSAEHWTDFVSMNAQNVFDLSTYAGEYTNLGDPYRVQVRPESMLSGESNAVSIQTGDSPSNSTGCSLNNSLVYTGMISSSVPHTAAYSTAEGCLWTVEFDDGSFELLPAPPEYTGANTCSYTSADVSYNSEDAVDVAMFSLLSQFDFDSDNRSDINFETNDLVIVFSSVGQVPYMWGPSIVELNLWK